MALLYIDIMKEQQTAFPNVLTLTLFTNKGSET